jgi:regulator of protease activity HflC (stomatin/prohibitin superfamily)
MKITLNYNTSITFDISPGDIADALDPNATPADIEAAVTEAIDQEASQRPPGYRPDGKSHLVAAVAAAMRKAAAARGEADEYGREPFWGEVVRLAEVEEPRQ